MERETCGHVIKCGAVAPLSQMGTRRQSARMFDSNISLHIRDPNAVTRIRDFILRGVPHRSCWREREKPPEYFPAIAREN
jgi:hypothetical protein